jgi:hypothetical protein
MGLPDGLDPVADADLAATEKVGAQAPSMHQTRYNARARKSLQMHAWLAKALSECADGSDAELPSNESVEINASGRDVPA